MYLVFDIGGTNMRIGVSSDRETLKETKIVPTPKDFEQGIQALKQVADELSGGEKIEGVAGGIAVIFDKNKDVPVHTSHLHGWVNKPLKKSLEGIFHCPIFLENDTAVVGLGEAKAGTDLENNIIAYITISTGVGGVRIVDGKIDRNALGFEPGHQVILPNGSPCHCGGKGHWETLVGGYYLERDYKQKPEQITDERIWNEVAKYLGLGLCNTIVHWSPDVVILGGPVMQSVDLEKVKSSLKEYLTIFPNPPEIIPAKLGSEGGLYGALELLKP